MTRRTNTQVSVEANKVRTRSFRLVMLLMCLSATSVGYALELLPVADAAARQIPEPALLIMLGLALLIAAHHARKRPSHGWRVRPVRRTARRIQPQLATAPEGQLP